MHAIPIPIFQSYTIVCDASTHKKKKVPGQFADKELEFVKAVVRAFDVGPAANQTRIGVASFSSENEINFQLNRHQSNDDVLNAVDTIEYMGQGTHTSEGIELVRTGKNDTTPPAFRRFPSRRGP